MFGIVIGLQLCFGQAVDPELLKLINSEVAELKESVKFWKDDQVPSLTILLCSHACISVVGNISTLSDIV